MVAIQNTYYRSMHQMLEDFESASSSQEVCNYLVLSITKSTGLKGCSLMLKTPDNQALFHSAAYGLSDWFVKKGPVIADQSITETLAGKSVTILDGATDDRVFYRKQIKDEGIASILSTPVTLKGNIIGVVRVYSAEPHEFNTDDISFVNMAASFGAAALENIGFNETLQKDYEMFGRSMRQMRSELGNEWNSEPDVELAEDKGIMIPFGG
jgi:signal transduction protein with GAF and PtsI domain